MNENARICIAGAGSIGCFIGGLLKAAGRDVTFLGRPRLTQQLTKFGLTLTDFTGLSLKLDLPAETLTHTPSDLGQADIILVCVKSGSTPDLAEQIRTHSKPTATIVSLQNGVRNAEVLRKHLNGRDVRAGMVPFNVVQLGEGRFHRGTSGDIVVESGSPDLSRILTVPHLSTTLSTDMKSVLWGKLLLNLNNGLNALSDLPLVQQLEDREWRRKFADLMSEALKVMKAEGITPKPPSPVPAWVIPYILKLPTPLFKKIAKQMLSIDPKARSSMWEDLQQGRKTEIDDFQGEIIQLGKKHGIATPMNSTILNEIKQRELVE